MQQALMQLLEYGFNPYEDNGDLEASLFSKETTKGENTGTKEQKIIEVEKQKVVLPQVEPKPIENSSSIIEEAIKLTLSLKAKMMKKNSFVQYKSRIGAFEKWLIKKEYYKNSITFITKKVVIEYLNTVL
jgi:hypothetical protein